MFPTLVVSLMRYMNPLRDYPKRTELVLIKCCVMFLNRILVWDWSKMLGFRDFWKKKDKNFYLTKDDKGFPLWVVEPPFPIEVEPEDEPIKSTPEVVSDYISKSSS